MLYRNPHTPWIHDVLVCNNTICDDILCFTCYNYVIPTWRCSFRIGPTLLWNLTVCLSSSRSLASYKFCFSSLRRKRSLSLVYQQDQYLSVNRFPGKRLLPNYVKCMMIHHISVVLQSCRDVLKHLVSSMVLLCSYFLSFQVARLVRRVFLFRGRVLGLTREVFCWYNIVSAASVICAAVCVYTLSIWKPSAISKLLSPETAGFVKHIQT